MLNAQRKGFMLVISSPSGAGKTTLSRLLLAEDDNLIMSVSATTRARRELEQDGKDYFFVNSTEFEEMKLNNQLLEYAIVFGNNYGTPKSWVENNLNDGKDVLFDIDWQGAASLAAIAENNVISVFILPPSLADLKKRLQTRGQDSEEVVLSRMDAAKSEISHYHEYDYVIVNEYIDQSLSQLKAILNAERLKVFRQTGLTGFVNELLTS